MFTLSDTGAPLARVRRVSDMVGSGRLKEMLNFTMNEGARLERLAQKPRPKRRC